MMLVVLVLIAVQVITYDPAPQREAVREAHRRGCVREGDQWRCRS
jgi:hypothetical protein